MFKTIENVVERILWESRLVIIFAVFASILSAMLLIFIGTYDVYKVFSELLHTNAEGMEEFHALAVTHIIAAVDSYLIATVLLIFGLGLYELFISKIDIAEADTKSSRILVIHDLDQLKEKLAKVILLVLIVTFFKHAVYFKYENVLDMLYLSIGILLIALSIYLTHKGGHGGGKGEDH